MVSILFISLILKTLDEYSELTMMGLIAPPPLPLAHPLSQCLGLSLPPIACASSPPLPVANRWDMMRGEGSPTGLSKEFLLLINV